MRVTYERHTVSSVQHNVCGWFRENCQTNNFSSYPESVLPGLIEVDLGLCLCFLYQRSLIPLFFSLLLHSSHTLVGSLFTQSLFMQSLFTQSLFSLSSRSLSSRSLSSRSLSSRSLSSRSLSSRSLSSRSLSSRSLSSRSLSSVSLP